MDEEICKSIIRSAFLVVLTKGFSWKVYKGNYSSHEHMKRTNVFFLKNMQSGNFLSKNYVNIQRRKKTIFRTALRQHN